MGIRKNDQQLQGTPGPEPRGVMTYEDAKGERREESACDRCISHFSWEAGQKKVIEHVLHFHYMMEDYAVAVWQKAHSQYSSSDYSDMGEVDALLSSVNASNGPFELTFQQLQAIRGSMHLALAAGVKPGTPAPTVFGVVQLLDSFSSHLFFDHRDDEGKRVYLGDTLKTPIYLGCLSLEKSWYWAPKFAGKSLPEIGNVLKSDVDSMPNELKADLADEHRDSRGKKQEFDPRR